MRLHCFLGGFACGYARLLVITVQLDHLSKSGSNMCAENSVCKLHWDFGEACTKLLQERQGNCACPTCSFKRAMFFVGQGDRLRMRQKQRDVSNTRCIASPFLISMLATFSLSRSHARAWRSTFSSTGNCECTEPTCADPRRAINTYS